MQEQGGTITIASSGTNSTSFQMPKYSIFLGFLIPSVDDGAITLQVSLDNTNFYTVADPADGQAFTVLASGSDPAWIDVSDVIRFIPKHAYLRLVSATSQTSGAVTIYWFCAG